MGLPSGSLPSQRQTISPCRTLPKLARAPAFPAGPRRPWRGIQSSDPCDLAMTGRNAVRSGAACRKLLPAFIIRELLEAQPFSVEFAHRIDLASKQDHARHFHLRASLFRRLLDQFLKRPEPTVHREASAIRKSRSQPPAHCLLAHTRRMGYGLEISALRPNGRSPLSSICRTSFVRF